MAPQISINIITHNRAKFISRAVKSVLEQSLTDWELIIVDDASSDNTAEVIKSFNDDRIKYHLLTKQDSIGAARNIGLELSQGKYVAIIDDDDYWIDKNKLKNQVEFLINSGHCLVGTAINLVNQEGQIVGQEYHPESNEEIRKKITVQNMFAHSTVLFLRDTALAVHGYNPINLAEDYSLWLKLGTQGGFANLADVTTNYTINNSTYKHSTKEIIEKGYAVVKDYFKFYPRRYRHILKWLYRKIK